MGDVPQLRYDGAGTIYEATQEVLGDPISITSPGHASGVGYAQFRFARDLGGRRFRYSAWSNQAAFEIGDRIAPTTTSAFFR